MQQLMLLLIKPKSVKDCTLYTTLYPDEDCAHAIILAGIKEVICCMFTRNDSGELDPKMEVAAVLLETRGIQIQ